MDSPESPNTLFQFLYCRYRKVVPIIFYDNACKLLEYCLNREPWFFRFVQMFIDRIHFKNHVGCSNGHSADAFDFFRALNTQVAEQGKINQS